MRWKDVVVGGSGMRRKTEKMHCLSLPLFTAHREVFFFFFFVCVGMCCFFFLFFRLHLHLKSRLIADRPRAEAIVWVESREIHDLIRVCSAGAFPLPVMGHQCQIDRQMIDGVVVADASMRANTEWNELLRELAVLLTLITHTVRVKDIGVGEPLAAAADQRGNDQASLWGRKVFINLEWGVCHHGHHRRGRMQAQLLQHTLARELHFLYKFISEGFIVRSQSSLLFLHTLEDIRTLCHGCRHHRQTRR
mmetsp:Transcript_32365/g.37376  ORF Transcript_32365/g.37376 Transcript_32365/m.37376 type:complete len:249 (-) Transcript_32365:977-1723(-)